MYYLTVTTAHRNFAAENAKAEEWLALEKEYFEKIINKNEFIVGYKCSQPLFYGRQQRNNLCKCL